MASTRPDTRPRSTRWRRAVRRLGAITVGVAALGALAGCAALGRATFAEPLVELREVQLVGLGLDGGNLDVILSVYNPNRFSLDATRLTYRVDVDSVQLGDGALDSRFVVARGDTALVRVPVRFTYRGLGEAGRQLMASGSVNYRVRGDLSLSTPIGSFTRPYDRSGRFNTVANPRR
jgi:LEA14-like dessication related protein